MGASRIVPIALAILLTFVLTPPVTWLERWIGRIPAVLAMVTLVFTIFGLAGWGLARQMDHLAEDLPRYRANILAKIADVRSAGKGGSVEKLQDTIEDIKTDLGKSEVPRGSSRVSWAHRVRRLGLDVPLDEVGRLALIAGEQVLPEHDKAHGQWCRQDQAERALNYAERDRVEQRLSPD